MHQSSFNSCDEADAVQIESVPRSDRWQVYHRLQELGIPCACPPDGSILVLGHSPVAIAQLWSVVRHHTAPRQDLLDWLGRCWQQSIR